MAAAHAPAAGRGQALSGWSARGLFTVAFLGVAAGVQMADRGLQAVLLGAIQRSYGVGDGAVGALQGLGGILVASALAIPLGRLADRGSRKCVLLALIAAWALLMFVSALAPTFALFFVGRAAAGVTEFAMIPLVYAVIPDLSPERHRVLANLSFAALMAAGSSAGFYSGQDLVDAARLLMPGVEPWRAAMMLLGAAGLPLLLACAFTLDTRARPADLDEASGTDLVGFVRARARPLALFAGVACFLLVAVQALNPLVALALERRFAPDMGQLGHALGIVMLLTTLGCLPLAGALDRALERRYGSMARPMILGGGTLVALPCLILLGRASGVDTSLRLVAAFLLATCVSNALVPTMLQDLVPGHLRARAFAMWSFVVSIFCAIGPLAAGLVSDRLMGGDLLGAIAAVGSVALAISLACAIGAMRDLRRTTPQAG